MLKKINLKILTIDLNSKGNIIPSGTPGTLDSLGTPGTLNFLQ